MAQPQPWARRSERSAYLDHLRSQQVANRELAAVLREAAKEADQMVLRLAPDPRVGAQVRRAQLQQLSVALRRNQAELWGHVTRTTAKGIQSASLAAAEGHATLIRLLAEAGASPLLAEQFSLAARFSAESVRAKYLNDVRLSGRVYRNSQLGVSRANAIVSRGLAQNLSARELAGRVRHLINPHTPGGVSYAAKRLARTEINNAFHATAAENYDRSPFVEGVKWELSGSHPRPDDCDDLADEDHDGLGQGVFLPLNLPHKPHPQCLCYTIAVTPTPEQFSQRLHAGGYDDWISRSGISNVAVG